MQKSGLYISNDSFPKKLEKYLCLNKIGENEDMVDRTEFKEVFGLSYLIGTLIQPFAKAMVKITKGVDVRKWCLHWILEFPLSSCLPISTSSSNTLKHDINKH